MEQRGAGKGIEVRPASEAAAPGKSGISAEDKRWLALGALALVVGVALRLQLATASQTPGHGDSAFYYTVAKNIVDGRGLVVDYVVYFFAGLVPITHYAGDFWNPLAEILLSLPMMLLGKSVFHALLATITAGIVPAVVAYFVGRRLSNSVPAGVMAGILTFFAPYQVWMSTRTEAIIFFGAFGSLAVLFAIKGRSRPRMFLLAALCTGLTHLVRQDGILLLLALLGSILLAPIPFRSRLALCVGAGLIHTLVISPLLIRNDATFGSLMQPGPSSTMFLTTYEDFHAYGKTLDWQTLRATWGIRELIVRRLHTAAENLGQIEYFLDPVLVLLTSLGIVSLVTRRKQVDLWVFLPIGLFSLFEYLFYSFVASFSGPGTLPKALAIVIPFASVVIVELLRFYIRPGKPLVAGVLLLAVYGAYQGYQSNYVSALYYNRAYADYRAVEAIVLDDAAKSGTPRDQIVIMARDVWDVYEATGLKTVMIPNNDMDTILFVARHYGVGYMLLPAPRKALDDIYMGTTPDSRFSFLGRVPHTDLSVFKLNLGAE
jgi:4-amino-4-deoxy-L-arabinose transferase-like glycosyltransferase